MKLFFSIITAFSVGLFIGCEQHHHHHDGDGHDHDEDNKSDTKR